MTMYERVKIGAVRTSKRSRRIRLSARSRSMTRPWLLIAVLGVVACHQSVTFQGEHTLAVQGAPPPPPPEAKAPPRVELRDNKIAIHDKIQFDYDKATIRDASAGLMTQIADVI